MFGYTHSGLIRFVLFRFIIASVTCFGVTAWGFHARAQQSSALTPNAQDTPSLRITTHLVQVNVIVNDNHGNPIRDLTKEDFSVFDNKKPQRIEFFSADARTVTGEATTPIPPDTYTNRIPGQSAALATSTVILFDALNTQRTDQELSRKQIIKALDQLPAHNRLPFIG